MRLLRFASVWLALVILVTHSSTAAAQTYVRTESGGFLVGPSPDSATPTTPTGPLLPGPTPSPTPSAPVVVRSPLSSIPDPRDLTCCLQPREDDLSTIMAFLLSISITRYTEDGTPIAHDEPVRGDEIGSICWTVKLGAGAAATRAEGWVIPRPSARLSWAIGVFNADRNPFEQFDVEGATLECIVRF